MGFVAGLFSLTHLEIEMLDKISSLKVLGLISHIKIALKMGPSK
jgi:hypothetical protein